MGHPIDKYIYYHWFFGKLIFFYFYFMRYAGWRTFVRNAVFLNADAQKCSQTFVNIVWLLTSLKKNITGCHFLQTCQKSYLTISFEEQENKVTKLIYKFVAGILTSLKCYRSAKTFIQVTKPKWVIYLVCLGRLFYKHFMHTKIITPSSLCYTRSENTCTNLCAKRRLPKHYHKHNIITGP